MDVRNRRGAGEVLVVLGLTFTILTTCCYFFLHFYFENAGIVPGVHFLGHDLGYLKQEKALERIDEIVQSTYSDPVYLKYRDRLWILRYGEHFKLQYDAGRIFLDALEIGRKRSVSRRISDFVNLSYPHVDLAWHPTIDREFSLPNISKTLKKVSRAKIYARRVEEEGMMELTILSGEMAMQTVLDALETSYQKTPLCERRVIELDRLEKGGVVKQVGIFSPEEGFSKILAESQTRYDPQDPQLTTNISLTLEALDGTIVNPGQIFSFNDVVGERTAERGFQEVPVFLAGKIDKSIERGVRQVATGLYKPSLLVGARIIERFLSEHYTTSLDYCEPGLEATVTSTSQDFKFQNTLDSPILVQAEAAEGTLHIRFMGVAELPYRVEIRLGRLQKISYETKIQKDPALKRGLEVIDETGIDGYTVKVFRTYFTNDGVRYNEEQLGTDTYLARPSIIRIGAGDGTTTFVPPTPTAVPPTAISTEFNDPGFEMPEGY